MVARKTRTGGAGKGTGARASKSDTQGRRPAAPTRIGPRTDKGDGEAAVQARIAALGEPSRSILDRLHPLIMKHATGLDPVVRYGFAIYKRGDKMVLVAAPRKAFVTFGYTNDAGIDADPVKFTSADQIDEAQVAAIVQRLAN